VDYLSLLNESQREAVIQIEGPVLVIAGAGSGKTRVLTYRLAHMLNNGANPFNILALTFTNKAAKEMRERVLDVVGSEAKNLWLGTFHSIFARILRIESEKIGYPRNFTIYDSDDSKSLLKSIVNELKLDDKVYKPSMLLSRISSAKNNLLTADMYLMNNEFADTDNSSGRPKFGMVFKAYQERCFRAGAMDFDDLLLKTHELLAVHLDVLNKYQHMFKYIMVDEFQDTNHAQYMIIRKLASVNQNIAVVGDDAQSIYGFRGANIKNILGFQRDFPDTKTFKLEQNYRSTKRIVDAAGDVIKRNKEQLEKKVFTLNEAGDKIKVLKALTDNEEGKMIASSIFRERANNQVKNRDFAILYRTNSQSRALEEALRKINIPYKIYGGLSFYHRKEIKDLLAYFRLTINHKDEEAFKRVINYPARGIGKTTLEKLVYIAGERNISIWEVVENSAHYGFKATKLLEDFCTMIKSFTVQLDKNAYDLGMHIAKSTGILKELYEDRTVEGIARYENLEELLNGLKEFGLEEFVDDDGVARPKSLVDFMSDVALLTNDDKNSENSEDTVSLMTIHSAKGLEFKYVYVSGLEENLFPSSYSLQSPSELEEERRLFYVAITRAMKKLTLSFATSRFKFGSIYHTEASRFLSEIDPQYLDFESLPQKKPDTTQVPRTTFIRKTTTAAPTPSAPTMSGLPKNLLSMKKVGSTPSPMNIDPNFAGDDTSKLIVGQKVQHQRFGIGTVTNLEGNGDSRKANIDFIEAGMKVIVLKFAKLKIK